MRSLYAEHRPRRAPGRYVACTWTQANTGRQVYQQLVVPDGCADLIWYGGTLRLVGPDRRAWRAPIAPGSAIAGVRLRPGAARLLLGRTPVDEVRDQQVPLELLLPEVEPLAERLAATGSPDTAALVLESWLAGLAPRYEPDPAVEQAIRLVRPDGTPRLPALADAVGLSERQLRRRFTAAVGYGPKTLHGILRFQRALGLGRGLASAPDGPPGLAAIAYEAGYADQAHFAREVRRLAGVTPTALLGPAPG